MAGTLNIALTQQFDIDGSPLAGAQLFFFQVGTVATLQNSFQDFGLTIANTNPLIADQFGRIPMFYLADGQVHVRLTDASGVVIFDYPTMQVIGPSSGGGGGGGSIDPTTIASTGDFKWRPTTETLTGWVKANALTIGNATSGASERANADTQALFTYLWTNFTDAHCPVVGGRGANAGADFSASKQITVPDLRSRSPFGLDDMGAAAAGRLLASNVTSAGDGVTTPAATGGEANHTLVIAEAPSGQITLNTPGHTHQVGFQNITIAEGTALNVQIQQPVNFPGPAANVTTSGVASGDSITDHAGGGAHNNMPDFMLGTWFVKL